MFGGYVSHVKCDHIVILINFGGNILILFSTPTLTGDMVRKTARSFLYELCAAYYWKPPEFELCKDEGPSHLRK